MQTSPLTASLAAIVTLITLAVVGISQGAFGIDAGDVARLLDAAVINAWPCKWYGN